ncbi:hypothetical protein CRG98_006161 [Punica granatum]|uniref:Uncharacterized protein n=1 Tax=Punica granatum TaxID=22663 RepID=A0A2I0KYM0_PUNGR|nr:hypothetical protein CRG98_006161 [Punica granatum]
MYFVKSRDAGWDCKKSGWNVGGPGLGCFGLNRPGWTQLTRLELFQPNWTLERKRVGSDSSGGFLESAQLFRKAKRMLNIPVTRLAVQRETTLPEALDGILMQDRWFPTPKRIPEVTVVVVWFQSYRARPRNRPNWVVFGSDITTVAPDGILTQGQWLLTPKRPPEVTVVIVRRKESRIDSICKENHG